MSSKYENQQVKVLLKSPGWRVIKKDLEKERKINELIVLDMGTDDKKTLVAKAMVNAIDTLLLRIESLSKETPKLDTPSYEDGPKED